uniref:Uncharacterized protein n=1 Tax=Brassica oleracea TaxID=3712 RepID=A0A3P6ECC5_BRAOL|nr:unnamed protein product [Brassica oleracea]
MGSCISLSLSCDQCTNQVFQWLCIRRGYIHNLKENLKALETTMEELQANRDDLSKRVEREEGKGLKRLSQIQVWLTRVDTIKTQVNAIFGAIPVGSQRLSLCGFCSKNLKSRYRYGKRVFLMLKEVENLNSGGDFEVIAEQAQASEVEERPIQPGIVGRDTMLKKAWPKNLSQWDYLIDDCVCIMGLHGMGGVGKTTLLTQINNKFRHDGYVCFDIVAFKDSHTQKIQEEIANKLGMVGADWNKKDKNQKASDIHNFLKWKTFVLLLEDIWEKVNLSEIGIPFPNTENGCKVIFTTRSQEVCRRMVGEVTLQSHLDIPYLANMIARKCYGLPLALNVIGETMSCKRTIQEWQHAVNVLTSYAAEFSGMEDEILPILKYSYDNLKDEKVKLCLQYCSLFPEDERIYKDELVNYLIFEGVIDGDQGIEKAENQDERRALYQVYMHDVVREMALWIASDFGKQKDNFIVRGRAGLCETPKVKNWNVVRRMSLMSNKIADLSGIPECLHLTTLLMQKNEALSNISNGFFRFMSKLVVLDLSYNRNLSELPAQISDLVSLQYLNMSKTNIECLPLGFRELKKLRYLNLEFTWNLSSIVGISSLLDLKVLRLRGSGVSLDVSTVEELQVLEQLEILTLGIGYDSGLVQFLSSHRLISCIRDLEISGLQLESSGISFSTTMNNLQYLEFLGCTISEIKIDLTYSPLRNLMSPCFLSLSHVYVQGCKILRELTWLMFAPSLTYIDVEFSEQLEYIISKEKASVGETSGIVPFLKLKFLRLSNVPELKNIYWSSLPFPCLKTIIATGCPNLKRLPLNSKSGLEGEKELIIRYREKEWIEGVEWEDEATKTRFLPSCVKV